MIDYYALRRQRVDVEDLFREQGRYAYRRGWNPLAVMAFIVGSVPAAVVALTPGLAMWAPFSWFIGAAISGIAYAVLARGRSQIGADDTPLIDPSRSPGS